jgi:hypothetical protein
MAADFQTARTSKWLVGRLERCDHLRLVSSMSGFFSFQPDGLRWLRQLEAEKRAAEEAGG